MAKKLFLKRQNAILQTEVPSVSRGLDESEIASTSRNSIRTRTTAQLPFMILNETFKAFPNFKASGRTLLMKFKPPGEAEEPTKYLEECITSLTNYLVNEVPSRDLVGLRVRNTENLEDKTVAISLRRRDQFKSDQFYDTLGKIIQNNARFGLTDRLEVHTDHVRMPAGNSRAKTKGRSLDVLSAIKRSIVVVKTAFLCLAQALIIAMARVNGDPKYALYRDGYQLNKPVDDLLMASGVGLSND
jgi:hypothetical protein